MWGEAGRDFGANGKWSIQTSGRIGTTGWRMGVAQYPLPRGPTPHRIAPKLLIVVEESAIVEEFTLSGGGLSGTGAIGDAAAESIYAYEPGRRD